MRIAPDACHQGSHRRRACAIGVLVESEICKQFDILVPPGQTNSRTRREPDGGKRRGLVGLRISDNPRLGGIDCLHARREAICFELGRCSFAPFVVVGELGVGEWRQAHDHREKDRRFLHI